MANELFVGPRRCVLLLDFDVLGTLMYLPEGAKVTGVQVDPSRPLIRIGIEGAPFGKTTAQAAQPPEIMTDIAHTQVHIMQWPMGGEPAGKPGGPFVPGTLDLGPRLAQPPLTPPEGGAVAGPSLLQFPGAAKTTLTSQTVEESESEDTADDIQLTSPCEMPEEE